MEYIVYYNGYLKFYLLIFNVKKVLGVGGLLWNENIQYFLE